MLTVKIHASPEKQPPVRNGAYQTENEDGGQTLNEDVGQTLIYLNVSFIHTTEVKQQTENKQTDNSMFSTSSFNKQSLRFGGGGVGGRGGEDER